MKSLPHSQELEQGVVSILLGFPELVAEAEALLEPKHFHSERIATAYRAMLEMQQAGEQVELLPLVAKLKVSADAKADWTSWLLSVEFAATDPSTLRDIARRIRELWGRRQAIRAAHELGKAALREDFGQTLESARAELEGLQAAAAGEEPRNMVAVISDHVLPGERDLGVTTGIPALDRWLKWREGRLYVVGGRPGMGKSAFGLTAARHAVRAGRVCAYFSVEMTERELADRLASQEGSVPYWNVDNNALSEDMRRRYNAALCRMCDWPLHLEDGSYQTPNAIAASCQRLRATAGLDLVVIDYLQLLQTEGRYETKALEIGAMTARLKRMAKDLRCPVLLLSQLSRAPERSADKRPTLADLRGSGDIEQDADCVLFPWREEYHNPTESSDPVQVAELIIEKQRGGPTGVVEIAFRAPTMEFLGLERREFS